MDFEVTEEEYKQALNKISKLKKELFETKYKNLDNNKEKTTDELEVKKEIQKCLSVILTYENIKKMQERGRKL